MFIGIPKFSAYSSNRANFGKLFQGKNSAFPSKKYSHIFWQVRNDKTILEKFLKDIQT